MCGIAGVFATQTPSAGVIEEIARSMAATLAHRGPDDCGTWVDEQGAIALGHSRLSILDLSPAGRQPMISRSGRYVIAHNGEIYNHLDLRKELERQGYRAWRGHSDTEILLAAFESWGPEDTLTRLVGMFAVALWDREERVLLLARDRVGEKPLYYGAADGGLLFGSELKSLLAAPGFPARIERQALALFMRHNYVPAPWTIYERTWKLRPGTYLELTATDLRRGELPEPKPYWRARAVVEEGISGTFSGSVEEARECLEALLRKSIADQSVADVPLGAFLSGGIDSSTVVALMQTQSASRVRTFTIGFHEREYDEGKHARAVAEHLGTEHTELYVTPDQALDVIPELPTIYDEPFADVSQVPTVLLSRLAQANVKVALSGDGGDELFGGYNRYAWATRLWSRVGHLPVGVRGLLARALCAAPPEFWNRCFSVAAPVVPKRMRFKNPGDKLHKLAGLLTSANEDELYRRLISQWDDPLSVVLETNEPAPPVEALGGNDWDFMSRMMYRDLISYLPDDILVKVDRAAMSVSLETRLPLLDHRVIEFAWRLPPQMKVRAGVGKWLLRQVLERYVPAGLIDRPKMGFGVPIEHWLRGPLREWAEHLLDEARLSSEGLFDPRPIRRRWDEHQSGKRNWQYHLWSVLMFQAWNEARRSVNSGAFGESTPNLGWCGT